MNRKALTILGISVANSTGSWITPHADGSPTSLCRPQSLKRTPPFARIQKPGTNLQSEKAFRRGSARLRALFGARKRAGPHRTAWIRLSPLISQLPSAATGLSAQSERLRSKSESLSSNSVYTHELLPTPCGLPLPLCRRSVYSVIPALVDFGMNLPG